MILKEKKWVQIPLSQAKMAEKAMDIFSPPLLRRNLFQAAFIIAIIHGEAKQNGAEMDLGDVVSAHKGSTEQ